MLVLTRKSGEGILIGDDIKITVVGMRGNSIRIGIDAPRSQKVHRLEVYERIQEQNREAVRWEPADFENLESLFNTPAQQEQP